MMLEKLRDKAHIIFYLLLSLIIIRDLLPPKYVIVWHFVIGPNWPNVDILFRSYIWGGILYTLSVKLLCLILPNWIVQRIIFFLVFFLSGYSAHKLVDTTRELPKYFAGLFYMINPFIYIRFIAGYAGGFLLAYAITPLAIRSATKLFKEHDRSEFLKLLLILTAIAGLSSHFFALNLFAISIVFTANLIRTMKKDTHLALDKIKLFTFVFIILMLLNAYWIIPALTTKNVLGKISEKDIEIFKPHTKEFGEIVTMHGYWYYYPEATSFPDWQALFAIFFLICLLGVNTGNLEFLIILILALILSMGVYDPTGLYVTLYKVVPFFKGFRDCHKFASLLALSYSYLGAKGIDKLLNFRRYKNISYTLIVIAFLIPPLLTPNIFSLGDFMKPTDYPKDWYTAKNIIDNDKQDFHVLVLPWHMFMSFDWVKCRDKHIRNPADVFFSKPVIYGENVELPGIYSQSTSPVQNYVESKLSDLSPADLRIIDVKYIVVFKTADYKRFGYLKDRFVKVFEGDSIVVYLNSLNVSRFYTEDLKPIYNYSSLLGIYYSVKAESTRYIFIPPNLNAEGWSGENRGFYVVLNGSVVYYNRVVVYLFSYAISVITFVIVFKLKKFLCRTNFKNQM